MTVGITAWSSLSGEAAAVFAPRADLPQRKHIKLMSRAVRLGVATVGRALNARPDWQSIPPERRGLFVGTRPVGATEDLAAAIEVSRAGDDVDLVAFGDAGLARLNPLWLVKGLSNNIPGYACAYWDLRGPVANRCEGGVGGLSAIIEAIAAVNEGRVDLAIAGGADCLLPPPPWVHHPTGEGAAFVVLERDRGRPVTGGVVIDGGRGSIAVDPEWGDVGAATGPLLLARALGQPDARRLEVADPSVGISAWLALAAGTALA